ncbi:MAG: hypothetical protein SWE60_07530 [Thermodesulfobacteriota bacterium]|nr:hypothetical protein [Thermodesulfobacteriota bacterium]
MATKPTYEDLEKRVEELERLLLDQERALAKQKDHAAEREQRYEKLKKLTHSLSSDLQHPLDKVMTYLKFVEARYKGRLGADADAFIASAVEGAEEIQRIISAPFAFRLRALRL